MPQSTGRLLDVLVGADLATVAVRATMLAGTLAVGEGLVGG